MTKNNLFKMYAALALLSMSLGSCMKTPDLGSGIKSEVEVPSGAVNYFENSMNFGYEGGDIVMSFKVNLKWEMKIAPTQNGVQWLTIDKQSGNSGNNKVTFTAKENPTYEDRSVVVQLSVGDTICNVKVNQKRLEAITLTSDQYEVSTDGGNIDVEVNHSADYSFTIPDNYKSWIHVKPSTTRGLLDQSIVSFTIDPSEEYEKREGKIYFTSRDEEEVVTVYQAGKGILVLSQNEYNLTGTEQEFSIDISSNFDFSMEMPEVDWLKENTSKTRGMSSHTLKFKVTENDDYDARSAKIRFYDNNSKLSETVVINQASIGAVLTIDTLEYNVSNAKQDLDIEIMSNFVYNVDFQGSSWVRQRAAKTRGVTSRLLRLTIDENKTYDARTAKIKLYDKNSEASEVITITQGAKGGIEIPQKSFTLDELGGEITLTVNSNVDYKLTINDDWIKEAKEQQKTRGLESHEHKLTIAPLADGTEREGTITISNDELKYSETIKIKQNNTFYFEGDTSGEVLIGKEKKLTIKNLTKQDVEWSSSNISIATVENGTVKGISKGSATITVKTADGKHIANYVIKVCEISDMISVKGKGTVSIEGDIIKPGSNINWTFKNNSPVKVTLKSMQLIGNETGETGNEIYINEEVAAESSVTKTTTIGSPGFHLPVKCIFIFVYNGKEYSIDAVYEKPNA